MDTKETLFRHLLPSLFISLPLTHFSPCVRRIVKQAMMDRRSVPALLSRRGANPREGPCDGASMSSSTCLPDGYRTFQVWIFCDYCHFRLIATVLFMQTVPILRNTTKLGSSLSIQCLIIKKEQ